MSRQGDAVLRFEDVRVSFGAVQALKGISLSLMPGEVHAIVGENGAGKSTLMAVAVGEVNPGSGSLEVVGVDKTTRYSPERARELGVALVHQHSVLLPDLTVAENMRIAVPRRMRPAWSVSRAWAGKAIRDWAEFTVDPSTPARDLSPEARSVVEISKALVQKPTVLILDEPTENLSADAVPRLFAAIRMLAKRGTGIIYISHRIGEVKTIADRISVLRDGVLRGTFPAEEVSESEVVDLVAGRAVDAIFPAKGEEASASDARGLEVVSLSGSRFHDVSFHVAPGEIVGLAGIEGHGQGEILRALAGLDRAKGAVRVGGRRASIGNPRLARASGLLYIPRDRIAEGLMGSLSVRENITTMRINTFARAGIVNRRIEQADARALVEQYRIKAGSMESSMDELSGGNQQKVLVSRVLSSAPKIVLADEPTQGVDVGSRAEIYGFLRGQAEDGAGVLVVSSDFRELSGLCDRVLVVSQGRIAGELCGGDNNERNILERVLTSSKIEESNSGNEGNRRAALKRFLHGDLVPPIVILLLDVALAVVGGLMSPYFLSGSNLHGLLYLFAAMAFAAIAQETVIIAGGIDLSVGPLMGFLVVVASFVVPDGSSAIRIVAGLLAIFGLAFVVGASNWALVMPLKVPPMIATLVLFTALQGVSLILRPLPAGTISAGLVGLVEKSVGFVPVAAIVACVLAVVLDVCLVRTSVGNRLRALGSREDAAGRVGVRIGTMTLFAYTACAVMTVLAGLLLMSQVQIGDPTVGVDYTLISISAVVLGGASIFGGRGSFSGAVLGALLIEELDSVTAIRNLSPAWQPLLLGVLTLVAVGVYSSVRAPSAYLRSVAAVGGSFRRALKSKPS